MATIIKTATVKVTLKYNDNFFGVELGLENEDGLNPEEINEARTNAEQLARAAVNDYKKVPNIPVRDQVKQLRNKITELENEVSGKVEKVADPKEIAAVEALPLYQPKKSK